MSAFFQAMIRGFIPPPVSAARAVTQAGGGNSRRRVSRAGVLSSLLNRSMRDA